MAKVRMYQRPVGAMRTVTKPNKRWARQRPINRGGLKDHGGTPPVTGPMSITSVSPTTVPNVGAPTTVFTAVGVGFVAGSTIKYTVGVAAQKTAATTAYVDSTHYTFTIPAADLATVGAIAWTMQVPSGNTPVSGPNITRT